MLQLFFEVYFYEPLNFRADGREYENTSSALQINKHSAEIKGVNLMRIHPYSSVFQTWRLALFRELLAQADNIP